MDKFMKYLELLLRDVVQFFLCLGFTAIGWNVCLVRAIPSIPVLGFKELMLLQLGINFVLLDVRLCLRQSIKNLLEEK